MLNMDYKNKIHDGNLNLDDKSFNEAPPLCICDGNV